MAFWNGGADLSAMLLWGGVLLLFTIYIYLKLKYERILFSIFNIGLFMTIFMVVCYPLMYENAAWIVMGKLDATHMYEYLNESARINFSGLILFYIFLIASEFGTLRKKNSFLTSNIAINISDKAMTIILVISVVSWYALVLTYNGTLPLLNGNRSFYKGNMFCTNAYTALSAVLPVLTVYCGIKYLTQGDRRHLWMIIAGATTSLFSGSRTDILLSIGYPLIVVYIFLHGKKLIRNTNRIVRWVVVLVAAGLLLALIRTGSELNIYRLIQELVNGNTFSDFRDGAYILYGYETSYEKSSLN